MDKWSHSWTIRNLECPERASSPSCEECYQVCMSKGLLVIRGMFLGVPTLQREIIFRLLLNISGEIDDIEGELSVRSGKIVPKI